MRTLTRASVVAGAVLLITACAATKFQSTWRAPDAQPTSFQGKKVAALVISPEESTRLGAEGELARELTRRGINGVPAYNLLPPNQTKSIDKEKAKQLFTTAGIEGVVVMRALGTEKEISSSPGGVYSPYGAPYYGSFWGGGGYWGYGWGAVYDPGYMRTDTIVNIETLVFDLKADKLIWAAKSQTTNPDRVDSMIKELVSSAAAEMKKQGLIQAK